MSRVAYASLRLALVALAASSLGGCALFSSRTYVRAETNERLCLARAMYFESNRSSDPGMMAVGTVVMNRLQSGKYPGTICGVVGQPRQFAPGALTLPFDGVGRKRALHNADRVLAGARQPGLDGVYHFHTAGYKFPYTNMHYVQVAGGNAFYQKRPGQLQQNQPPPPIETMMASAAPMPSPVSRQRPARTMLAALPLPPPEQAPLPARRPTALAEEPAYPPLPPAPTGAMPVYGDAGAGYPDPMPDAAPGGIAAGVPLSNGATVDFAQIY